MKKTFQLEELDCANCAAKMEQAIAKLDGVEEVSISFMQQKMTLAAPQERYDEILAAAQKAMRKIERDVRVVM